MAYKSRSGDNTPQFPSKPERRKKKTSNAKSRGSVCRIDPVEKPEPPPPPEFRCLTDKQRAYTESIERNKLTFGVGPAGVGKTYVVTAMAAKMLAGGHVDQIIITRPLQEAGEKVGTLPGGLAEKTDPYMAPLLIALQRHMGLRATEECIRNKQIQVLPIGLMRGRTLDNCFAILDEAQNCTKAQMKLFLTRIGEQRCRVVVDGDVTQTDIANEGLSDAIRRMYKDPEVGVVHFTVHDIVRSGLVQRVVTNYALPLPDPD